MEISALSALSDLGNTQNSSTNNTIAGDFDTFLTLLTTQLQNQNPLEPLDTNQFTQQLVEFASVEQSIQTNDNLEALRSLTTASTVTSAVSFVGKVVTASGDTTQLLNGTAAWSYTSPADSPEAKVTVTNSAGQVVFSQDMALQAGTNTITWDGRRTDGSLAPNGTYRISIDAKDADGKSIDVDTNIAGVVEAVDLTTAEPFLTVNGSNIKFSAVKSVSDVSN